MFKQSIVAAGLLVASLFAAAPAAEARTNIFIGIGTLPGLPYAPGYHARCYGYRYCGAPAYVYGGYPTYYAPRYHAPRPIYRARPVYRLSCGQARIMLRNRGWHRLDARDCGGRTFSFTGWFNGRPYLVNVNSSNGRILSRHRL